MTDAVMGHPNSIGSPRNDERRRKTVVTSFRSEQVAYRRRRSTNPPEIPSLDHSLQLKHAHHEDRTSPKQFSGKHLFSKVKVIPVNSDANAHATQLSRQRRNSVKPGKATGKRSSLLQRGRSIRLLEEKVSLIAKRRLFFKRARQIVFLVFVASVISGISLLVLLSMESTVPSVCCPGSVTTIAQGIRATSVTVDALGVVYIADAFASKLFTWSNGTLSDFTTSTVYGNVDGTLTTARFAFPTSIAIDSTRNIIYVATRDSGTIRTIQNGIVSTLDWERDTGPNPPVNLPVAAYDEEVDYYTPVSLAVDASGALYVGSGAVVEKYTSDGNVIVLAGIGWRGYADGPSYSARFRYVRSLAVDPTGHYVYLADMYNKAIRRIDTQNAQVTTMTLNGFIMTSSARRPDCYAFDRPMGIALNSNATQLYVADSWNNSVVVFSINGAWIATYGTGEFSATDDQIPSPSMPAGQNATFGNPWSVAVDKNGIIYVGDAGNRLLRRIQPQTP
ncbi:hypothetical protein LEN26_008435 [Aphanomyces euteiches]|nr:hypothetical protein AeMF1_004943 [Aphanomyces euteiches]KAH9130507.1 hypothetical protein LEN26_008435 [Aphanomyces euteiches]KAH9183401.1 hypothetical protein AeNC1_014625 [Aphanomyces euteiches]